MDHQAFVDQLACPSAVLSVEKTPEGHCGAIHIVCANTRYKQVMGPAYYDGMPYQELVPQDAKFEDFCFRAAHLGQRMHAYVETKALGTWTDQNMIPMVPASDTLGYCQFVFEFTQTADPERMARVSLDTANTVLKASFTLMGSTDFTEALGEVVEDIRSVTGAGSCSILLIDHERRMTTVMAERKLRRDAGTVEGAGGIPYEIVDSWEAMIGVSNAVIVKDDHDMDLLVKRNPVWVDSMRGANVDSLVLIPLRRQRQVFGYLYVVNFDTSKTVEVKELLELMAFCLGSEISSNLLMQRLEEMSHVDALTGLQNRNAMISRIASYENEQPHQPFGIVNLDLNGLKAVNDHEGHAAGDRLLSQAAWTLQKYFHAEDLYRTGGDEFIVIAVGITHNAFSRKVERLRANVYKGSEVSFALGSFWTDGSVRMQEAFLQADESMYADKRAYYQAHPEMGRR